MAILLNSVLFKHLSGKLGNVVFRQCGDKTVVAKQPKVNKNRIISPAEQAVRDNFKRCSRYAHSVMADPATKALYETRPRRKRQSPYEAAFRDAFHGPQIKSITAHFYTGAAGGSILVGAMDNFKVAAVQVSIFDRNYLLIEDGEASGSGSGGLWRYVSKQNNPHRTGTLIVARAVDLAGNDDVNKIEL